MCRRSIIYLLLGVLGISYSCTEDYYVPVPLPEPIVPLQTTNLEASYVTSPVNTLSANYWKEADYLKVEAVDLSTQNIYSDDGLLNMTGTYNGLASFNDGVLPELILKAAYDSVNLYILAEWADSDIDASRSSWLWNGNPDTLKTDSAIGWTSQGNDDMLSLAFEIESASSSFGTFSSVGCAAACHNGNMNPGAGSVDIWNWSLALSEPAGFAFDMHADNESGLVYDPGQISFERNITIPGDNRSGPAYEWDGNVQNIIQLNDNNAILDPAHFLLNKTPFIGNPSSGDILYMNENKGCYHCHGEAGDGKGDIDRGPAFTDPAMNRFSRESFIESASSPNHTGQTYFNKLTDVEKDNIIAKIRGFSGVPGYYLAIPDEAGIDISATSNLTIARLNPTNTKYQILLIRKLDTGDNNDIKFDLQNKRTYNFGIALMDNDGKNHIGSLSESLIFIANE